MTRVAAVLIAAAVLGGGAALSSGGQSGAAYFVRSLQNPAERREARPDILDAPVLPGSVMKTVTLAAALDHHVIEPDTARMCRRVVTINGTRYTCTHPDLKRPMTPAEALAYSCNDFFTSLAPRLTRPAFNQTRALLGLPPVPAGADLAASFVGLAGPRLTPRALLDVVARLAGVERPVPINRTTRTVLLEGLRGAARYGSASALATEKISALAKTGTAPMPGGAWMGVVVALTPAAKPTHGIVVVAPGAAGLDAAAIAADLLAGGSGAESKASALPRDGDRSASSAEAFVSAKIAAEPISLRISIDGRLTTLPLEDYIARVVAGEGQPKAPDAAQQALAITARTFAVANRHRHRREGYDLCDTTHCQVVRPATAVTRRAAAATAGRVLVHQGRPASVFYSALCGGHSELASEVWPGAIDYGAASRPDDACRGEPGWTSELRADQIERALRAAGHRGDRLRDLRVVRRNASGRVARVRVDGFTPNEISGHDFRMAVGRIAGWQQMKSTAFDVRRIGAGYRFTGRGFGHGVGLCVIGAGHRALRGARAEDILQFYFPTLRVETFHAAGAETRVATATPAGGADDVLIALPAEETSERAHVVSLVRRARDEVAKRAGVTPPSSIRITVHPTVEAFGRATGQPWWVSAATAGTSIDLLPLSILRRQGQLERTIRHEVAHVLLDPELQARPLWVREGAAFYFADPDGDPAASGRVQCPADEEFLRPLSAGAHRAAYARADACFRRAIAQGRRWNDVD